MAEIEIINNNTEIIEDSSNNNTSIEIIDRRKLRKGINKK